MRILSSFFLHNLCVPYLFKWLSKRIKKIRIHDFSLLRYLFFHFHTFEIRVVILLSHSFFLFAFHEGTAVYVISVHMKRNGNTITEFFILYTTCTCLEFCYKKKRTEKNQTQLHFGLKKCLSVAVCVCVRV